MPRNAEPTVTATTSSGKPHPSRWNRSSRIAQVAAPASSATTSVRAAIGGTAFRTGPSPPAATTARTVQCCSGNVRAAAAKLQ